MKKINLTILLLCSTLFATAQSTNWSFDPAHSKIQFSVAHMVISEVTGQFKSYNGSILSDKSDFSDAKVNFTIDINSVDTDNLKRDKHLRSEDFFDVAKYPSITFTSTSIEKVNDKKYLLKGNITMHGVTKEVTLNLKYGGTIKDPWGNTRAGFKVTGSLDRTAFNLNYNSVMAAGGLLIGNDVDILCNVELIKH